MVLQPGVVSLSAAARLAVTVLTLILCLVVTMGTGRPALAGTLSVTDPALCAADPGADWTLCTAPLVRPLIRPDFSGLRPEDMSGQTVPMRPYGARAYTPKGLAARLLLSASAAIEPHVRRAQPAAFRVPYGAQMPPGLRAHWMRDFSTVAARREGGPTTLHGPPVWVIGLRASVSLEGVRAADMALPVVFVQRGIVAFFDTRRRMALDGWWGSIILPRQYVTATPLYRRTHQAIRELTRNLGPVPPDPLPDPAPVPLPPAGVALFAALGLLWALRGRSAALSPSASTGSPGSRPRSPASAGSRP
jgi:hypothetical protein